MGTLPSRWKKDKEWHLDEFLFIGVLLRLSTRIYLGITKYYHSRPCFVLLKGSVTCGNLNDLQIHCRIANELTSLSIYHANDCKSIFALDIFFGPRSSPKSENPREQVWNSPTNETRLWTCACSSLFESREEEETNFRAIFLIPKQREVRYIRDSAGLNSGP